MSASPASPSPRAPIVVYRFALSGHCHRVESFIAMLGLPMRLVDVDLMRGEQRKPEFLALNRFGQVPVIDDGGTVVADSNAILAYLALRYAPTHWMPRDAVGAARVQRWLSLAAGPLDTGAATARFVTLFKLQRDIAGAVKEALWLFERMEATLAAPEAPPWLAGPDPTIADLALYAYTARAPEGGVSLDPYASVRAWVARVEALPGFVAMPVTTTAEAS